MKKAACILFVTTMFMGICLNLAISQENQNLVRGGQLKQKTILQYGKISFTNYNKEKENKIQGIVDINNPMDGSVNVTMKPGENKKVTDVRIGPFYPDAYKVEAFIRYPYFMDIEIDFVGGSPSRGTWVDFTLTAADDAPGGDFTITAQFKFYNDSNEYLGEDNLTVNLTIIVPVTANFTGSPTAGEAPLRVQFTDKSIGSVTSWDWDFGDGGTSSEQSPSHIYQDVGSYTVSLEVSGPAGSDTKTRSDYINVTEPAPVADFRGSPRQGEAPLTVQFTDNSTGTITDWDWDFGDGEASTEQSPSHTYQNAGTFTVALTITGPGGSDTKSRSDYINVKESWLHQDSLALVVLYNSSEGLNWTNNTNWLTSQPLSEWYGITVENGRVTLLDLGNNNLVGTIPSEIGNLTNLKTLILRSNTLSGAIPGEIGNLTKLESLNFYNNQLAGIIPPEIGNLTNLIWLYLSYNQFSGPIPNEIGNLSNVKNLRIDTNKLSSTIPSTIGNLIDLQILSLSGNQLMGTIPPEIGNLTNLERLYLEGNNLSGAIPNEIGNLTKLDVINLTFNQLSGEIPSEIGNLTNLTGLYLYRNQLSGDIPLEIGNLTSLTSLSLYSNELSGVIPSQISNLKNLTSLDLAYNQLSGAIPPEIGDLSNLVSMSLGSNQLSGAIPTEVGNLINLNGLYLGWNQLSGAIPTEIANLSNLRELDLRSNQLSGSIPPVLGNLTNLEWLGLAYNQLSGDIPSEIGNLTQLRFLNFSNNQISGPLPNAIGNLTNLKWLYLDRNRLSGAIPAEIVNLANLTKLRLSNNHFKDLPNLSSIATLTELQVQNNKLTFEDIEPNISVPNFTYSPQDSVGTEQDTTITVGSNLSMSVSVGGTYNQYQWVKNAVLIPGATDSSYSISSVYISHAGSYICEVTNTLTTALTLYSRSINVTVTEIGADVRIEPAQVNKVVGDTLTVRVAIDSVTNLGSFQFDIEYSTSVVHSDSAWLGAFLTSTGRSASPVGPIIDNSSERGKITFGGFSFGASNGPEGSGVLALVRFSAQDSGTTILDFKNVQVTTINGQVRNVDVTSGGHVRIVRRESIPSLSSLFVSPNPTKSGVISVSMNFKAGLGQIDNSEGPKVTFSPAHDTTKFKIQQTSFQDSAWEGTVTITDNMNNGKATIQVEGVKNTLGIIMPPLNNAGSFIIDTVAPMAFELLSPQDSSWTNERLPTFSWKSSVDTTSGLASYSLFLNSELNTEYIPASQTSVTPISELEDGDYSWKIVAKDSAGNTRECNSAWLFRVDKTPPTSTITSPSPEGEVSGTIMVQGTASDGAGIGVDSVLISTDDGHTWYEAKNTSDSTWQYEWKVSRDGPITILTKAIDKLGNEEIPHGISVTDVEEVAQNQVPTEFELFQNYPNPFNPETTIRYQLPRTSRIKLFIYNLMGQRVATLVDEDKPAGFYSVHWDGKDEKGRNVASGVYLYRLETKEFVQVKKLVLAR